MYEPSTDEDNVLDDKDEYYPDSKAKEKSAAVKVYRRAENRKLPVDTSRFVNGHFEKSKFVYATAYCQDGKLHIGGAAIEFTVRLVLTEQIETHEQPYMAFM